MKALHQAKHFWYGIVLLFATSSAMGRGVEGHFGAERGGGHFGRGDIHGSGIARAPVWSGLRPGGLHYHAPRSIAPREPFHGDDHRFHRFYPDDRFFPVIPFNYYFYYQYPYPDYPYPYYHYPNEPYYYEYPQSSQTPNYYAVPQSELSTYEGIGRDWGMELLDGTVTYEKFAGLIRTVLLPASLADREAFHRGFIAGYGQNGEAIYLKAWTSVIRPPTPANLP